MSFFLRKGSIVFLLFIIESFSAKLHLLFYKNSPMSIIYAPKIIITSTEYELHIFPIFVRQMQNHSGSPIQKTFFHG